MPYSEDKDTQMAQDAFIWYEYDNEELPEKEDIEKLNQATPFADQLKKWAKKRGYSGDLSDLKALHAFQAGLSRFRAGYNRQISSIK